jgi:hypothetical protein
VYEDRLTVVLAFVVDMSFLGAQDKTSWMLIEMAPVSRGRLFLTGLSGRVRLQEGIF